MAFVEKQLKVKVADTFYNINTGVIPDPPSGVTFTSSNKTEAYILNKMKAVTDWADTNGLDLLIGEYGIPTNEDTLAPDGFDTTNQDNFNAAGKKGIEWWAASETDGRSHYLTNWAIAHEGFNTYFLSSYDVDNGAGTVTPFNNATAYEDTYSSKIGVNYAGNEFYVDGANDPPTFGSGLEGNEPSAATFAALYARGVRIIRYPIGEPGSGGQWLWDVSGGALRTSFFNHVKNMMNNAQDAGIKVILDVLHPGNGNEYATMEGAKLSDSSSTTGPGYSDYIDYVTALMTTTFTDNDSNTVTMQAHPAFEMLDPVNEPQYGVTNNHAEWEYCMQQIITDLRANGVTCKLVAVASHYSGLQDFPSNTSIYTDPSNNLVYGFHFYFDCNNCGGCGAGDFADYLSCRSGEADFSESIV